LVAAAGGAGDDAYVLTATELHRRAVDESAAGQYGRARALLNRALDRADDDELTARILVSLADAGSDRGSWEDGLALCERALAIPHVGLSVRGLIHAQRALLLMRSGNNAQALKEFDEALPMLDPDEPVQIARLHLNRGNVHLQAGDLTRARLDLERCLRLGPSADGAVLRAKAEHNLGYVHMLAGDLVTALRRMDSARPVLAPLSPVSSAICDQDRAEVMATAGLVSDASQTVQGIVAAFDVRRLRQQQGKAELVLARLLMVSGEFKEAGKVARRAARRFYNRGSVAWRLRAELLALSCEVESHVIRADSLSRALELSDALCAHGLKDDALAATLQAARCAVRAGELQLVETQLEGLRPGTSTPISIRLLHRQTRAEWAAAAGRRGVALRHVRAGLADLHSWQSSFGSLDLQTSLVGHGQTLAGLGLSMAVDDGRPEVLFEWSERSRALASRVPPVRPPPDSRAAAALAELRRLQLEQRKAEPSSDSDDMSRRVARLRKQIRQRSWYGAGAELVMAPTTLDEVGEALEARGGALISYLVADDALHAVVVTERDTVVRALGPVRAVHALLDGLQADLDVAASLLPKHMRTVVLTGLNQRLDRLSALLWEPLSDSVGDRPAVLVPPGALVGVPWSMLPGLDDRPLAVARSASEWLRSRECATPRSAGLVSGPDVPRAEEEVLQAAKAWEDVRVLTGPHAVAAEVSALAAGVDVLHVASHGRHAADNPLFSGLDLVDGPWFGYDIDRLPRVPSTVVLSACELGRSAVRWGAETIGMTVAWLHAGTSCVIASPARVDDDVACEVLARTHEGLATGQPPSVALAAARAESDSEAVVPFICFGAGW
jgi:tetratricopeptide (TPR) repeat protein